MTADLQGGIDPASAERLVRALGLEVTDEQRAVVFGAPAGPAVVIAGAGSGKTAVMAARIAVLVATGQVAGEQVLGLTFTRKAAAELAERVDGYLRAARRLGLIDPHAGEPEIATYHSFSQRFVREHGIWIGIDPDLRVESDFALLPLAYQVVARSSALNGAEHDFTLSAAVTAMRRLDAALAEHVVPTERLRAQEALRQQQLARTARDSDATRRLRAASTARAVASLLVDEFRAAKADAGVMDYADMMRLANLIAAGSDEAVSRTREAYPAVLLDEYQDTSVVQRLLLQRLFGGGHRLLAVGDPKQSIYGFRGAAAASMEAFAQHFPAADGTSAQVFALTSNFRSGPGIVAVANAAAASRRAARAMAPGDRLRAARTDIDDTVEVHTFRSAADEQAFLVAEVKAELAAGRAADDIIVLARSNGGVAAAAGALAAAGIPVTSSNQAGLFDLPEVKDVLAVLAVVVDPSANADLMRLLTGPRWAIGVRDLALLGARARHLAGPAWRPEPTADLAEQLSAATAGSDPVELPSLADALGDPGEGAYSDAARRRFALLHSELEGLARHAGEPVPDLLARIIGVTGMDVEVLLGADAERRLAALDTLMGVAGQFHLGEPAAGATGFLRAVRLAGQADADPGFDPPLPAGCVRVMTVHKAKGLQAGVVLLPGFSEAAYDKVTLRDHWTTTAGSLPDDLRGDLPSVDLLAPASTAEVTQVREVAKREAAAESDRLVYVALTRARERLVVSTHWWDPELVRAKPPSRHLLDMAEVPTVRRGHWYEPPDGADNPCAASQAEPVPFPQWDAADRAARQQTAAHVARVSREAPDESAGPSADQAAVPDLVARWDADIAALRRERQAERSRRDVVVLPDTMSVTEVQRLLADPQDYAMQVRRPMPRRPSAQARRGTRFHDWVAARWQQRVLIDDADLAADRDLDLLDDAELAPMAAAFEAGVYADRRPTHIEYPFTVVLAGIPVSGRIDAVYADGPGWEVVDWKTGARPSADPLQLAVYRLAWAKLAGVPPEAVSAAFYYVPTGRRVVQVDLPDEEALGRLLTTSLAAGR